MSLTPRTHVLSPINSCKPHPEREELFSSYFKERETESQRSVSSRSVSRGWRQDLALGILTTEPGLLLTKPRLSSEYRIPLPLPDLLFLPNYPEMPFCDLEEGVLSVGTVVHGR